MLSSPKLEKHFAGQHNEISPKVMRSLDAIGLLPQFRKQVEILLSTVDEKDALHPSVQEAIISWNSKIIGIQGIKKSIRDVAADDDYIKEKKAA